MGRENWTRYQPNTETLIIYGPPVSFTIVGGIFSIVAPSVNARKVHAAARLALYSFHELVQPKLVAAQLALSVLAFLVYVLFAVVYVIVTIRASAQASKQRQQSVMPVRRS